jgi:hypothetical protein
MLLACNLICIAVLNLGARFARGAVRSQEPWFLSNVEDIDLVASVTKTIFVVAGKNRVRFFDDQTNFVTGSEAIKVIAVQNQVVDNDFLCIVITFAN